MLNVSKTTLMRSCDKNMTEKIGIPDAVLMENAANAVAQSIKKHTAGRKNGSRVFILIGPGNNGGDGTCAAPNFDGGGVQCGGNSAF